ncbi:MAG: hypothetical protein ABI823_05015 [Bryobacteraceae bacterium]
MVTHPLRISHVGLRGVVGSGLTATHAMDFAAAFGTFLPDPGPVLIGRDPRASGEMLREGVIASLLACGRDVVDLGIVSTPVIQHAIARSAGRPNAAAGGISISASHNTAEWNALRFFGPGGTYLSTAEASELLDIYHLRKFAFEPWDRIGRVSQQTDAIDRYLDDLNIVFKFDSIRNIRVIVDCASGTSSVILKRLNERFGLRLLLINEHVEGMRFAHEPTTSKRVVALQLAPLVKPVGAEAGFLFDLDADRVAMATELGEAVSEEMMLALLADDLLARGPGKLVITNLSTTALLDEIAARHGGRVVRVPVGRQAATDALATYPPEEIAVAGEGSGAVMMPQFRFVYDGIAAMFAVLRIMRESERKLSELVASYPRYEICKGEVPLSSQRIPALFLELRNRYADGRQNTSDGLRVDWPDSEGKGARWFHVRVSQTEPVVRVYCEQCGETPSELFEELLEIVRQYAA